MPVVPGGSMLYAQLPGRLAADPLPAGLEADCSVRVVRVAPGPRNPHLHPHSAELSYVVQGTGTAREDDVPFRVGPGDLLVVPPGVPHATVASGTSELVLVCFFPHSDLAANIEELTGPLRSAD
jgi:quercetin dioxygenase-like cupin family protein